MSKEKGIYTLANDIVYDQLIALLNSIEANYSKDIPVCVIPYNDNIKKIEAEIEKRKNVSLFLDKNSIGHWEVFAKEVWEAYLENAERLFGRHSITNHRKFCCFDGPFKKFVFYESDSLAMKPLEGMFQKLEKYDFVFDDWQHKYFEDLLLVDLIEKIDPKIEIDKIRALLHAGDFFGSKAGIFGKDELSKLQDYLIEENEIKYVGKARNKIRDAGGWWDDVYISNYLTFRSGRPMFNLTLSPDGKDRTGNCANIDPFVNKDNVLYNEEGLKPIHRIHFMKYASKDFSDLCKGKDADVPYKDVFCILSTPRQ